MQNLLYLTHRIPYPPTKGDKIRSYHVLKHLSTRYRVYLGTFVDTPADWAHADAVRALCADSCIVRLRPSWARMKSLFALGSEQALTVLYYRSQRLKRWVDDTLRTQAIERILVFSSAMAQYALAAGDARRIIDFVDIDSDKWRQYVSRSRWPQRALYEREHRLLARYERRISRLFEGSLFVSQEEAQLFSRFAPETAGKTAYFANGVDADYFSPAREYANPYPDAAQVLAFTGAMDYWPNVDAVEWFAHDVFPLIQARHPDAIFYIVGVRPARAVRELSRRRGIVVTGAVPDIRPYLAHARLAVAPLRLARGVQNKVLEAMAMGKPVVASPQAAEGIEAAAAGSLLIARHADDYVTHASRVLSGAEASAGRLARDHIVRAYDWTRNLATLEAWLEGASDRSALGRAFGAAPGTLASERSAR